jgi:hypothetical protein
VKLKERKAYFQNDKVAIAKQKMQEKESEMGMSSDDVLPMMCGVVDSRP